MVTNHSLLAVDMLAGRHIVPPHKLLVVDEAHELADRVSSASQAELTPELVERAARRSRPLIGPGAVRDAHRGRRRADRGPGRRRRPGGSSTGCRRRCARRARCSTRPPAAALERIGDIKADDPDPVRKQQAKSVLDELSKTAQRLLEEADHDVAWVEKPDGSAAGGARWWSRRCRSPAPSPRTSTRTARWSPPRRRWRWAGGSTRWPGRSACRRRRRRRARGPRRRPTVVRRRLDVARRRFAVRLHPAGHPLRGGAPAPPGGVRAARPPRARSCSRW